MTCASTVTQIGRGVIGAGALAALILTSAPTPAHAGGPGVGAAIGLGVLGGVIAGAAIASSQPPFYAGPTPYGYPPQYYNYPPQYYYQPAPGYYGAPYYGPGPYGYPW
jgi:hypothetical protein